VPLSEEEQRLLEQMEQALAADDPKFASTLRGSALAARGRRQALIAAVVFVLGVAVLMIGAVIQLTLVAVAGFVVMLASAYFFAMAWRRAQTGDAEAAKGSTPGGASVHNLRTKQKQRDSNSFMDRMEERWRRRRDDQDGY
jgi:ABC-type bacteriocin/lantibiotic exporter with double-glycine peptidase domain